MPQGFEAGRVSAARLLSSQVRNVTTIIHEQSQSIARIIVVTFLTWEESSRAAETRPASNPWAIRATSAGRPRSRSPFEAHQPVVGGVLVCLAPRRDGESRVDEAVDGAALVHHELPDVDELGGKLSDDVHS